MKHTVAVTVSFLLAFDAECFQAPVQLPITYSTRSGHKDSSDGFSYCDRGMCSQSVRNRRRVSKRYASNRQGNTDETTQDVKSNKNTREKDENRNPVEDFMSNLFGDLKQIGGHEDGHFSTSTKKEKQDDKNPITSFLESIFDDSDETRLRKRDLIRSILRRLANLSLQDYKWRSDYFKKTEADRRVDESLARMMGEEPSYIRPMDASDRAIGPLGQAEKTLVDWLSLVIEEEGRRARLISSSDGELVRPMDLRGDQGGPLSSLENAAVNLLDSIRMSEKERVKTRTIRPKDLEEEKRGPLGNLEARVSDALDEIVRSESLRMEQSRKRGGEVVRPIDVPGPLGEMEMWYLDFITAERQRTKDREKNNGKLVRPQDATIRGPMGTAERQFSKAINVIQVEERERLKSLQKVLETNRPMEKNRESPLGWTEAIFVGVFRAPQMIFRVMDRVGELLDSDSLPTKDANVLKKKKGSSD